MFVCPPCRINDEFFNDCVDPCYTYGPESSECEQFGCRSTTITTTTPNAAEDPTAALELGLSVDTLTVIGTVVGVVSMIVMIMLIIWQWRRRKRRQSRIEGTGKLTCMRSCLFLCFIISIRLLCI